MEDTRIAVHQWTHSGDRVLIVRFVDEKHQSYGKFQWPTEVGSVITCPDWDPKPECGNGLHGWPWGIGIGEGKEPVYVNANWQVVSADPKDVVYIEGKVKCREVRLEYVGSWWKALQLIEKGRNAWIFHNSRGSASNIGDRGSASNSGARGSASNSGYRGSASNSGYRGSASNIGDRGSASNSGDRGSASNSGYRASASNSGYRGSASNSGDIGSASNSGSRGSASNSGDRGSASNSGARGSASNSGDRGSAETSAPGTAAICTGLFSKARAAEFGCIALAWWNEEERRTEMRCSLVGKKRGQLKPDTWYQLDDAGEFAEVK